MTDDFEKRAREAAEDETGICWCAGGVCSGCEGKTRKLFLKAAMWARAEMQEIVRHERGSFRIMCDENKRLKADAIGSDFNEHYKQELLAEIERLKLDLASRPYLIKNEDIYAQEIERLKAEIERVKEVCMDLNRQKNSTFEQSCKNRAEADELKAEIERVKREVADSPWWMWKKKAEELKLLAESLRVNLANIMKLIEDGKLVRDISNDNNSDWAIQQMKLVQALVEARAALDEGET